MSDEDPQTMARLEHKKNTIVSSRDSAGEPLMINGSEAESHDIKGVNEGDRSTDFQHLRKSNSSLGV